MTDPWTTVDSPLGELILSSDGRSLTGVSFAPSDLPPPARADDHPVLVRTRRQLTEYFHGERETFDLPLAASGSEFSQRVWGRLGAIPYGTTTTYGALARDLGLTGHGARAVGLANGANPLAIVVPCHRVVGRDGRLTGYAGGIERKRRLLALERSALC